MQGIVMSVIKTVLSVLAFGGAAMQSGVPQQLLRHIAMVVALTVISAVMTSALLVGGVILGYFALVQNGFDPIPALLIALACLTTVTVTLISMAVYRARTLLSSIEVKPHGISAVTTQMHGMVDAFIDGLLTPPSRQPKAEKKPAFKPEADYENLVRKVA